MGTSLRLNGATQVRACIANLILGDRPADITLGDVVLHPHQLSAVSRVRMAIREFGGALLCDFSVRARLQIEALLGTRVYLDLHIKVARDWQRDPKQLRRLGFYD